MHNFMNLCIHRKVYYNKTQRSTYEQSNKYVKMAYHQGQLVYHISKCDSVYTDLSYTVYDD